MDDTNNTELVRLTSLLETVSGTMKDSVMSLIQELIEDYECHNALERSLCEIIANSYGRVISTSQKINTDLFGYNFTKDKVQYFAALSKELDRQNRTYLAALNTLLEIKNPQIAIHFNSENTIIWNNQQFNTNQKKKWKD